MTKITHEKVKTFISNNKKDILIGMTVGVSLTIIKRIRKRTKTVNEIFLFCLS